MQTHRVTWLTHDGRRAEIDGLSEGDAKATFAVLSRLRTIAAPTLVRPGGGTEYLPANSYTRPNEVEPMSRNEVAEMIAELNRASGRADEVERILFSYGFVTERAVWRRIAQVEGDHIDLQDKREDEESARVARMCRAVADELELSPGKRRKIVDIARRYAFWLD